MSDYFHPETESLLRCPATWQRLERVGDRYVNESGTHCYPIKKNVPFLVTLSDESPALIDELLRYRRFFSKIRNGEYEPGRISEKIEEISKVVDLMKLYFECMASAIDFTRKPLILDTGAGMMETSRELERRGGRVIATDFSPEEIFNPRIYSFFDTTNHDWRNFSVVEGYRPLTSDEILFDRVLAPTERLPFASDSFDVVFTRSSLHHLKNIRAGLSEMSRVLKPGGLLVVAGECIRPFWESEKDYLEDVVDYQEGIDEQVHTWPEYWRALRHARLKQIRVIPILASGGKHCLRCMSQLKWKDPFHRLEQRPLDGLKLHLLRMMGCVVGWTARKAAGAELAPPPSPPPPPACAEGEKLADWLVDFDENLPALRRIALKANAHLPCQYDALSLPQPECIGFGLLTKIANTPAKPMFRSGKFVVGKSAVGKTVHVELFNQSSGATRVRIRLSPAEHLSDHELKPGPNTLKIKCCGDMTTAAIEMEFLLSEGSRVCFIRLSPR